MSGAQVQVHVDLDNLWVYEEEYGASHGAPYSLIYTQAVPRLLELLGRHRARATFFVIGRDLDEIPECVTAMRAVLAEGHEIANHTYRHSTDFHRLTPGEKLSELRRAHETIEARLGVTPEGFRAPGFYLDAGVLQALATLGYRYDSSVLPGIACPLMALYMRAHGASGLDKAFGRPEYVFASPKPTLIRRSGDVHLVEIPIGVVPGARLPVHPTFAYRFGHRYARWAAQALRWVRRSFIYLLHAIDVLEHSPPPLLSRHVLAMRTPLSTRLRFIEQFLVGFDGLTELTTEEVLARDLLTLPSSRLPLARAAS